MADTDKPSHPLHVFLCHSSADKPAVRELYQRLQADSFEPWLDEEELIPGQDWRREIPKAVKNSDVVIVCLSCGSINKAGYIQKEIRVALDVADEQPEDTIFIIPLKLEECKVPDRLSRWQWVDYFASNGYNKLLRALRTRAGSHEAGTPVSHAKEPSVEPRPTLQPSSEVTNRSGGINVDADQVNVGQDVIGRDMVVSASGHIIHAEAGATVIISQNPPSNSSVEFGMATVGGAATLGEVKATEPARPLVALFSKLMSYTMWPWTIRQLKYLLRGTRPPTLTKPTLWSHVNLTLFLTFAFWAILIAMVAVGPISMLASGAAVWLILYKNYPWLNRAQAAIVASGWVVGFVIGITLFASLGSSTGSVIMLIVMPSIIGSLTLLMFARILHYQER